MSNFDRVSAFLQARGKPPTAPHMSMQVGELIWAITELLDCITVTGPISEKDFISSKKRLRRTGSAVKRGMTPAVVQDGRRKDFLRALCEVDVNLNALAYLAQFDKNAADTATLDAVDALLVDGKPILSPGGKLQVPEGWQPADLTEFI